MENTAVDTNDIIFPSIVFKVRNGLFSVDSRNIIGIAQLPEYQKLVDAPPYCMGFFVNRGDIVQLIDMRILFSMESMVEEYEAFVQMIDQRKQDHYNWIAELESCLNEGREFTLATDHHKCALGKWYDNFHTENQNLMFHLKKLEEPHRLIHQASHFDEICAGAKSEEEKRERLLKTLQITKDKYVPEVMAVLNECEDVFKETAFREMVLILKCENGFLGIVVDEVLAVEELDSIIENDGSDSIGHSPYIHGINKSKSVDGIILRLDDRKLSELCSEQQA